MRLKLLAINEGIFADLGVISLRNLAIHISVAKIRQDISQSTLSSAPGKSYFITYYHFISLAYSISLL